MKRFTSTKGQVWSLDMIIGIVLFMGALLLFYKLSINNLDTSQHDSDLILLEAQLMSGNLLSAGYPYNWTSDEVVSIGITDGDFRIDEDKVVEFSKIEYIFTKDLLSTTRDYSVSFLDRGDNPIEIAGLSSVGLNISQYNPPNIIKITRFVIFNSSIIKLEVSVW
ncbi:hypothetical protein ACFLZX_02795 [Nanoarchaeota archaeon]